MKRKAPSHGPLVSEGLRPKDSEPCEGLKFRTQFNHIGELRVNNLAPNEKIVTTRVYTFPGTKMIKVQVIGQQSECLIGSATQAEEVSEQDNAATSATRVLVLKNEKNEVVGKFAVSKIAGWWQA